MSQEQVSTCQTCRGDNARLYELYSFTSVGESVDPMQIWLCVRCARRERRAIRDARAAQLRNPNYPTHNQITRDELIAAMDRFWAESGAGDICRRCHEQGTGCCPPMCRHLGAHGCLRKNVFCTSFVCSALLNAIAECDADTARLLKWMKWHPGSAEFRLYEMVTRVPAVDREAARPLAVLERYPGPLKLTGESIQTQLQTLAEEVLEIRRRWHQEELAQVQDAPVEK